MGSQILAGVLSVVDSVLSQAINSSAGNTPVLLMLGSFAFSLNTAVFQSQERTTDYRWASIERFGQNDAMQFTGFGDDVITLPGVIYPNFQGGAGQVEQLRQLAAQGQPQRLISATGTVMGYWVITRVRETQANYAADGSFLKQEFSVELKFYGANLSQ